MKRSNIFWGLILIIASALLSLKNFGVIDNFFNYLWVIALLFLGIWLIISAVIRVPTQPGEKITVPLEGASNVVLRLDHGAGRLKITSGDDPANILVGHFHPSPILKTVRDDGALTVKVKNAPEFWTWLPGERRDWDISLKKDVPIKLDIDSGASSTILDLSDLKVTDLDLDTGASTTEITLPSNAGFTHVKIDSGAATLQIHIPAQVSAQIKIQSGMASVQVDKRFPRVSGNLYSSPDYASAANRADISIETGMASVLID